MSNPTYPSTKQTVLDEDAYTEAISYIVERDFFPNLAHLKAKINYLDATEHNDPTRISASLNELQRTATPDWRRSKAERRDTDATVSSTPRSFTPRPLDVHQRNTLSAEEAAAQKPPIPNMNMNLDAFQSRYTSEDNASFTEIMAKVNREKREKYNWVYQKETQQLKLLGAANEDRMLEDGKRSEDTGANAKDERKLVTWNYKAKNALMYVPEGMEAAPRDDIRAAPKEIVYANTRIAADSNANDDSKSPSLFGGRTNSVSDTASAYTGFETPRERGFSFVPATPTPMPDQVDTEQLMTWGEIEGTPIFLPGESTPGRSFKFPAPSKRDAIGRKLSEMASRSSSSTKRKAVGLRSGTSARTPTPTPSLRASLLSPAARQLLSRSVRTPKAVDAASQLRASYGSPRFMRAGTPMTPVEEESGYGSTPLRAFGSNSSTYEGRGERARPAEEEGSITDNLLKLS